MHEPGNHPIIITFSLRSISNHVNTNTGHKMINTISGNPRHLGINAISQWNLGWGPLSALPLEPTFGVVSTLSPAT